MENTETESAQGPAEELGSEKLFYSTGEVSEMTGVEPYVLRYWESEFKILHPSKRHSGQRSYQTRDIETILKIKQLLYEDLYTIAGAKKKLKEEKTQEHEPVRVMPARTSEDEGMMQGLKEIRVEVERLQEEIRKL